MLLTMGPSLQPHYYTSVPEKFRLHEVRDPTIAFQHRDLCCSGFREEERETTGSWCKGGNRVPIGTTRGIEVTEETKEAFNQLFLQLHQPRVSTWAVPKRRLYWDQKN